MNTEDSDILFVRLLLFPYYIVEKYAVSDAAKEFHKTEDFTYN